MYIRAKKGLLGKETNDGLVILSQDEDKMFILNNTASTIWKLCSSKVNIDYIVSNIKKEYEIKKDDLKNFKQECISIIKKNPELFEILNN